MKEKKCPAAFTSLFDLVFYMITYCRLKIKITQHKGPLNMITLCHAERITCHVHHHFK